ncbi:MAG: hypothetical protein MJ077_06060 [Oscillospiraceae bacterium]|nr:hypothetical protein [Oscillospiraceae bacterium]
MMSYAMMSLILMKRSDSMLFPYRALTTPLLSSRWKADYASGVRIKDVRFGQQALYLGHMAELGGKYLPYDDIVRWFISVEAAQGGEATFHIYRLVVNYGEEGEYAASLGEYSANLNEKTPLNEVKAQMNLHPEIPQGRDYKRKSRFPGRETL